MSTQQDKELEAKIKRLEEDLQYSIDNNKVLQRAYNNLDDELQELKRVIKRCFE